MLYMCKGAGGRQAKEEALALYVLSFHFKIVGPIQVDKVKTLKRYIDSNAKRRDAKKGKEKKNTINIK